MTFRFSSASFFLTFIAIVISLQLSGQCVVYSLDGYRVDITVVPKKIIAPATCPWGYSYNIELDYDVKISGQNAPHSLWTLQGSLECGNELVYFGLSREGGTGKMTTSSNPFRYFPDCNTVEIGWLHCYSYQIEIHGPGIPLQKIHCNNISPLPIELTEFHALEFGWEVHLGWTTASESNNDYFTIERSSDGVHWEAVLQEKGAGNSSINLHYTAVDPSPLPGISYYRLKQTDFNNDFSYSEIKAVVFEAEPEDFSIFPNPTTDVINFIGKGSDKRNLRIYNSIGVDVTHKVKMEYTDSAQLQIKVSNLEVGIYIVKTSTKAKTFYKL